MATLSPTSTTINQEALFNKQRAFPLQQVVNRISQRIENRLVRSKRQAAVQSALLAVAARHPDWADAGFDEHFIANQAAPLLADYYWSGQLPTAAALTNAWSNQFFWRPATKLSAQSRFMPIAQDFVYILSTES